MDPVERDPVERDPVERFHAHCESCPGCEAGPATACAEGTRLLIAATGGSEGLPPRPPPPTEAQTLLNTLIRRSRQRYGGAS